MASGGVCVGIIRRSNSERPSARIPLGSDAVRATVSVRVGTLDQSVARMEHFWPTCHRATRLIPKIVAFAEVCVQTMQGLHTPREIGVGTDPNASRQWDVAAAMAQTYRLDSIIDVGRQRPEPRPDPAPVPHQNVYALRQWRVGSCLPS